MPDELGRHGQVVVARHPVPVAAAVGHGALGLEREHQDVPEPAHSASMAPSGLLWSVSVTDRKSPSYGA